MLKLNNIKRLLVVLIVLSCLGIGAPIVYKLLGPKGNVANLAKLPANIDVSLKNVHYTETRKGLKKWDLLADAAEYDRKSELIRLSRVKLVFDSGKKGEEVTLLSDTAQYFTELGDVVLSGKVRATTPSGAAFSTESIRYTAARGVIETNDKVFFSDGRIAVESSGLIFQVATREFRLINGVTARINPERKN